MKESESVSDLEVGPGNIQRKAHNAKKGLISYYCLLLLLISKNALVAFCCVRLENRGLYFDDVVDRRQAA